MTETVLNKNLKIALVAGEKSGDDLGGPLMEALREQNPHIDFIGIGGEKMAKQGLKSLFEMSEISVMGIIEPLLKLKTLLRLRKELKAFLAKEEPDIFVGIDSPDFNLPISCLLYTSPSPRDRG